MRQIDNIREGKRKMDSRNKNGTLTLDFSC